jgi:hypothetical protein
MITVSLKMTGYVYIRVSHVKMTGAGVSLDMHMHRFWCGSEAVGCQPRAFFILPIVPGPRAHQGLVQSCQARSGGMMMTTQVG